MPRRHKPNKARPGGETSKAGGCLITLIFGLGFAGAGTAMFIFFTVLPFWNIYQAQSWVQTPCTITRSEVKVHSDSDGDTYSIDIRYHYTFNGQHYTGDRYRFAGPGSSSGRSGKQAAVNANPVGSQQTCYVDPDDPAQSVIHRGMTGELWWGLFPVPFMLVGFGVLYAGLTGKLSVGKTRHTSGWRAGDDEAASGPDAGPILLDPSKTRRNKFVGIMAFTVIWNGIIGIISYSMLADMLGGGGFDFTLLFLTPFLLVGLVMIGVTARMLMLIYAPVVVLELDRDKLPLGGSMLLRWRVASRRGSVERVRIALVGEEQATYSRGTDTVTDKHVFFERPLLGGSEAEARGVAPAPMQADHGEVVLTVPIDTMHSMSANNNKIIWKLAVRAEVARWPDPKDEHEITVLPMAVGAFQPAASSDR